MLHRQSIWQIFIYILPEETYYVGVEGLFFNDVTYYFIDNEEYFGDAVYRGGDTEGEQYAYFCRAVIEAAGRIGFLPDVLHCNDWQTGLIPLLLKTQYSHWEIGRARRSLQFTT